MSHTSTSPSTAPPTAIPLRHLGWLAVVLLWVLAATSQPAVAQSEPTATQPEPEISLRDALVGGQVKISWRYRFETVDDDAFDKDANASTLRTSLGYRTLAYKGFSLYLEAENITELGLEDQFSNRGAGSLNNGVFDRPVIVDPESTEVEQAYLRYQRGETTIDIGRQGMIFGDQRFVGTVAWRQNHQSFDALRFENRSLDKLTFLYAYVDNTNRIFGDNKPMASHLLNATFDVGVGALTLYGYALDYDRLSDALASTSTYGFELKGIHNLGNAILLFEAEYATQSDFADNPRDIDADYIHGRLGAELDAVTVQVAFESLGGGSGGNRFQTPLATLHKFNGWADKFLVTPPPGLEDLWLSIQGKCGSLNWLAAYHEFSAEATSLDYGQELDLQVTYKTPSKVLYGLKAALYEADRFSTDTRKIWLWAAYSF